MYYDLYMSFPKLLELLHKEIEVSRCIYNEEYRIYLKVRLVDDIVARMQALLAYNDEFIAYTIAYKDGTNIETFFNLLASYNEFVNNEGRKNVDQGRL